LDLVFVLIELFSLGVTADGLPANVDWKSAFLKSVQFRPNFHGQEDVSHEPFLHG